MAEATGTTGRTGRLALWALAAAPVLLAVAEAVRSPRMNFNDFWLVLGITTTDSGALDMGASLRLFQGQPAVLVSVVYWLDAKLFAGQNWVLGLFTVALAAVALAAMWTMLPARFGERTRLAVFAGLSALVFSSAAVYYFGVGMMGAWWMLGLTPSVVAIALAHRGRTAPAVLLGVVASLGHGSALPVWVALVLVAWLRRQRGWQVALPAAVGAVVGALWLLAPGETGPQAPNLVGADTVLATALATMGKVFSSGSVELSVVAGGLIAAVLIALAPGVARERLREPADGDPAADDAGWVGLAVHMAAAAAMIGASRAGMGVIEGLAFRYAGPTLLLTAAVMVLLVSRGPRFTRTRAVPFVLAVALLTYATGSANAAEARRLYPYTPTLAVAMHVDASAVIAQHFAYPDHMAILRTMRVYPFTDDFTLGCGGPELGGSVDLAAVRDLPGPGGRATTVGHIDSSAPLVGDVEISGWAMIDGKQAQCVLVVDQAGVVVGGGAVGIPRQDVLSSGVAWGTGRSGFQAVARPGTADLQVLLLRDGAFHRVTVGNHAR